MRLSRHAAFATFALLAAVPVEGVPDAVPFKPARGGAVIVPALVDGRGPYWFLVDTGATRSVVGMDVARELGLVPVGRMAVLTPAGEESRESVRVGRLSVGGAVAEGILASVAGADRLWMDGAHFDGLLGQDFLSLFEYTIDYRRRRVVWGTSAGDGRRLALDNDGGRVLVDLPQPGASGRPLRFVPDSGASALVVFDRGRPVGLSSEMLPGRAEVTGAAGGRRFVQRRRIRTLQIGDVTLRDQVAAVVDRRQAGAPEGDGLLPLHRFASVSFGIGGEYIVIRER